MIVSSAVFSLQYKKEQARKDFQKLTRQPYEHVNIGNNGKQGSEDSDDTGGSYEIDKKLLKTYRRGRKYHNHDHEDKIIPGDIEWTEV